MKSSLKVIILMPFLCLDAQAKAKSIRHIAAGADEVVTINTALGLSTLLELGGRPKGVIVGDQDAFRVEYAGEALAIKPLMAKARSNLFVSMPNETFRFRLRVVSQGEADFAVKVKPKRRDEPNPSGQRIALESSARVTNLTKNQTKTATKDALTLVAYLAEQEDKNPSIVISFQIFLGPSVFGNRGLMLAANDFHVLQEARDVTITQLTLNQMTVSENHPVTGEIILARRDLTLKNQISMIFAPSILGDLSQGLRCDLKLPQIKLSVKTGGHGEPKSANKKGKSR